MGVRAAAAVGQSGADGRTLGDRRDMTAGTTAQSGRGQVRVILIGAAVLLSLGMGSGRAWGCS